MKQAFTLVELVVTMGVFSLLAVFGVSTYRAIDSRNGLALATQATVQAHRTAHTLAKSMIGDQSWGVSVLTDEIVLFQGSSYSGREPEVDRRFPFSPGIASSGRTEVVYAKFSGLPNATGEIILTLHDQIQTITINEQGAIFY